MTMAPAASSRETTVACCGASYANAGQAQVVGKPSTSMLSLDSARHAVQRELPDIPADRIQLLCEHLQAPPQSGDRQTRDSGHIGVRKTGDENG
jgi:hypothetical protein